MADRVRVEIFGHTYHIAGDLDQEYVQKLAHYVDNKMNEVARSTQTVDTVKVAVLAALAIADELHSAEPAPKRTEKRGDDPELRERAERCLLLVEQALKQSA